MRVRLHKADECRGVVGEAVVERRDGDVGVEGINAQAVVVSEGAGFNVERRIDIVESKKVLPDHPLDVFGVRQRRRSPLGKDAAEELSGQLGVSRLRNHHTGVRKIINWNLGLELELVKCGNYTFEIG